MSHDLPQITKLNSVQVLLEGRGGAPNGSATAKGRRNPGKNPHGIHEWGDQPREAVKEVPVTIGLERPDQVGAGE